MATFGYGFHYGHPYGVVHHPSEFDTELVIDDSSHDTISDEIILIDDLFIDVSSGIIGLTTSQPVLIQQQVLAVDDTSHSTTSDNTAIIYDIALSVDASSHSTTSDEVDVVTFTLINPNSARHTLRSDVVDLIAHGTITVHDSKHKLSDNMTRIIDWASYNRYFGNYAERSPETGRFK